LVWSFVSNQDLIRPTFFSFFFFFFFFFFFVPVVPVLLALESILNPSCHRKTFSEVLDRQTSKIVDYYKQQMNMEQEAYLKRTKLEKAEREWEEQDLLERDTFMEQSLAATMIALEADFEMPASPRRYDEEEDMEYGMEYGEDEDYVEDYGDGIDLSPRRHHGEEDRNDKRRGQSVNGGGRSRGYVKATRHRNGKGNGGANQRFASSLPPRGSAMRNTGGRGGGGGGGRGRGGGGLGAGRKTTHFEEDFLGEERKTQQRMNRTYSGSRRRGGSGGATYDNDMLERKTVVLGEERVSPNRSSPNRGSNNGSRRLQKGSQPARGNRRTSFMAVETIKETYDAIIESPTKGIDTMSPAATTNNINNINTMENVESRVTRLHKTLPAVLEEGGGGENEGVEGTEETTGTGGTNGATTGVAVAKKGHRRSATVGVEATPTRVEKTTASNDKLSPTSETRQARAMLTTLFQNMDKACQRKEVTLEEYINTEFVKCKKITSGNAPRAKEALTYEQFMTFLINMETYVEQELNIYVGIMDMPAKRIDVAFSIFDVDGDLSIGLSSVVRFMKSSCRNKGGSPNGDGGSGTMTKEDDGEEEEQSQFRLAIRQMQKGANWVARKEKSTVQRVVTDAFIERDADGTGAVTTGQFAQIIHQLGIEMTRSMTEALLKDLGVQANSLPNQRCVNYKKLIETM
jgi:Ca2+-binding EF-hand superfamily protein